MRAVNSIPPPTLPRVVEVKPERGRILPHIAAATLFVGMVAAVAGTAVFRPGDTEIANRAMTTFLLMLMGEALWMRFQGGWRPSSTLFGFLLILTTAAGVPGLLVYPSETSFTGVMFFGVLVIRNYVCFIALPRSSCIYNSRFENAVIGWLLASSTLVMLGSLRAASLANISLQSATRLNGEGNNWLNANASGVYTATGVLAAVMAGFLPMWVRVPAVCLGVYVMLLTQSRASMLALLAAVLVNLLLLCRRKRFQLMLAGVLVGVVISLVLPTMAGRLRGVGQIKALLQRTEQSMDPWSGRLGIIRLAAARFEVSPIFGYGYMSNQSRFENGYLSLALETGLVGFTAAAGLFALVIARAKKLFQQQQYPQLHDLARYTIALSVFILTHAIGERTHLFQVAFTASNAWAVLAGLVVVHTSRGRRRQAAQRSVYRPSRQFA